MMAIADQLYDDSRLSILMSVFLIERKDSQVFLCEVIHIAIDRNFVEERRVEVIVCSSKNSSNLTIGGIWRHTNMRLLVPCYPANAGASYPFHRRSGMLMGKESAVLMPFCC